MNLLRIGVIDVSDPTDPKYPYNWMQEFGIVNLDLISGLRQGLEFVFTHPDPVINPDHQFIELSEPERVDDKWIVRKHIRELSVNEVDAIVTAKRHEANERINKGRREANDTYFLYNNHRIACDKLSKEDILGSGIEVANRGGLPPNWPGMWKTMDNQYVPLQTHEQWKEFFAAMYAQGNTNFKHSEFLKHTLAQARTISEIDAINWDMPSPFIPNPGV